MLWEARQLREFLSETDRGVAVERCEGGGGGGPKFLSEMGVRQTCRKGLFVRFKGLPFCGAAAPGLRLVAIGLALPLDLVSLPALVCSWLRV